MSKPTYYRPVIHVRCPNCDRVTVILKDDFWGKIFRCVWCTAIIADKRGTPPPEVDK